MEGPGYLPRENGRTALVLTMQTHRGLKVSAEEAADMISVILDKRMKPSASCPYMVEASPQSFILEEETGYIARKPAPRWQPGS